jgi:adenylate cyclase
MGWFDDAATVLQRLCRKKPSWLTAWTLLAGCHNEGGHPELGQQAAAQVVRIKPDFSVARWAESQLYRRSEDLDRHLASLRSVGLPESPSVPSEGFPSGRGNPEVDLPAVVTDRPSLAVLPFDNLSEDRALGLVADGLAEDVNTLLARIPGFFVIARRSSFFYRDRSPDIRQVGRELGIRYLVSGSIRGSSDRVRMVVNLFETEGGKQLWARQYDVERGDALEIQDTIARDIIAEVEPQLIRAELTKIRRQRPSNLDAWGHYHEAIGTIALEGWNEQSVAKGLAELRKAIALDSSFALAYGLASLWTAIGADLSLLPDAAAQHASAREAAERAVALDPNGPDVLGYAGCTFVEVGDLPRGRELLERALELDPSNAQARVSLGVTQMRSREFERGIENLRLGIRLSPRDSREAFWSVVLAHALAKAGRLDEALSEAQSMCRRDGRFYTARVVLATVLTRLGRLEEARAALVEARRIRPALNLEEVARFFGRRVAADLKSVWT